MAGRRIVAHQCRPGDKWPGLLTRDDVVFFDDCLYSQYAFFMSNERAFRGVRCVFGFSPGLARIGCLAPIEFADSAAAHRAVNASMRVWSDPPPDEVRAFMSAEEVRRLAQFPNVVVALHGCVHLDLKRISDRVGRLSAFRRDLEDGVALFGRYGFRPGVFVYPYAFCEEGYEYAVGKAGFGETYARPGRYRISVEALADGRPCVEDS